MSPPGTTAFIYSPRYAAFDYGPNHPLRTVRLKLAHDLIAAYGLLDLPSVLRVEAREAREEEVLAFHRSDYLDVCRAADPACGLPRSSDDFWDYGLGTPDNPVFPGLFGWSLLTTGASLQAMDLVLRGETDRAFNISGGLHHAAAAKASGFCYFNDAAVIIAHLVRRGLRVAYVDIDAHHGDGVQFAFYDTDRVLTISLHESGLTLFPGTGFVEEIGVRAGAGYSINVPFLPQTDDEIFLWAFEEVVPPLLHAFRPDLVVTQLGIDAHVTDPLSNLALTMDGFAHAVRRLRDLAPRWIALGGGGYNVANVPRAWALAWGIMTGQEPADPLPEPFRQEFQRLGFSEDRLSDPPFRSSGSAKEEAWRFAREQVHRLKQLAFARHGL